MNVFVSKIFPFLAGVCSISLLAADLGEQGNVLWLFRSVLAIAIGIIAWFLKRMVDEKRSDDEKRDSTIANLLRVTTAHDVMYQFWLEEMAGEHHPLDGQRKSDKLYKFIIALAEKEKL